MQLTSTKRELSTLKGEFAIDISFISILIILIIMAGIWANLAGMLTSLGLGGLNLAAKGSEWRATIKTYFTDRREYERSVYHLKSELAQ